MSGPALTRRSIILGGMSLATAVGAAGLAMRARTQTPVERPLGGELPSRIGDWVEAEEGGIVRPAEGAKDSIYDQEVSRVFLAPDRPGIMLLVAYGSTQSDTLQVHRPEFCYPAAGFEIRDRQSVSQLVAPGVSVPATFFTAVRGERTEQVLYWVRLGRHFPASWARQHLARIENSLQGVVTDGILVRASVIDIDAARSRALLSKFLAGLSRDASPVGRQALIGRPE